MAKVIRGFMHETDDSGKVGCKYLVFVASFLLEDLGQVLCQ